MIFNIGRGWVELQILKKWKWPNWVDYCDETLHTHWYWQDVAQEIIKYHLGFAEALPRFKDSLSYKDHFHMRISAQDIVFIV